jgi:hypothetical protein
LLNFQNHLQTFLTNEAFPYENEYKEFLTADKTIHMIQNQHILGESMELESEISAAGYKPLWSEFARCGVGEIYRFGPKKNHWMVKNSNGSVVCQDWSGKLVAVYHGKQDKMPQNIRHYEYTEQTSVYLARKGVLQAMKHLSGMLYAKDHLACPVHDINGSVMSYQKIYDTGSKSSLKGHSMKGGFFSIGLHEKNSLDEFNEILICEGLATGCSLYLATSIPTIVTFGTGNFGEVIRKIKGVFPSHKIMVCGDFHEEGSDAQKKTIEAASTYECYICFPYAAFGIPSGFDFNDLHQKHGLEEVAFQIKEAFKIPPLLSKFPITLLEDCIDEDDICHKKYKITINGKESIKYIKASDFSDRKKIIGIIKGWAIYCDPDQLKELISLLDAPAPVITHLMNNECGWRENGEFYLPPLNKVCKQDHYKDFVRRGSLNDFKERIEPIAQKNPLITFILAYAFLPPFLKQNKIQNFGIHLYGESSIGKTSLLNLAASVWGAPVEKWNGTVIGFEDLAYRYKDTLFCLDEIHQIRNDELSKIIYTLGNGGGRIRFKSKEIFKSKELFYINFLSSGESSIEERLKKEFTGGQAVRVIDISCHRNFGIFDHSLHLMRDVTTLHEIAKRNQNYPLDWLLQNFKEANAYFNSIDIENTYENQMGRIKNSFSLIEKAGLTAVKYGCLPPLPITESVNKIFDSLPFKGKISYELELAKKRIYELLETGESHFYGGEAFERIPYLIKGYKKNGCYYLTATTLRNEICKDINYKSVKHKLIKTLGVIESTEILRIGPTTKYAFKINPLWIEQYRNEEENV